MGSSSLGEFAVLEGVTRSPICQVQLEMGCRVLNVVASPLQLRVQIVERQQRNDGNGQAARRCDKRFGDPSSDGLRSFDFRAAKQTEGMDHACDCTQQTKERRERDHRVQNRDPSIESLKFPGGRAKKSLRNGLIPVSQRIGKRACHEILRHRTHRHRPGKVATLDFLEHLTNHSQVAAEVLANNEIQAIDHHRHRNDRGHQYRPHDRPVLFEKFDHGIEVLKRLAGRTSRSNGPVRWYLSFNAYDEVHGEPGGLTLSDGPNAVNYSENRNATSRFFDRMRISRYAIYLINEWDISDDTLFSFRAWWDYYYRFSRRQRGGGFGTLPTGPTSQTNQLETQQFYTFGIEPRIRHDWELFNQTHTLTGGMLLYNTCSPRVDARGQSPTAMSGPIQNQSKRYTWYYSVFAENKFTLGKLSITPGIRLESIWQSVNEKINNAKEQAGDPLANQTAFNFVPLFGIGLEYSFTPKIQAYANVSQAYRPPIFTQAIPTTPNTVVAGDLQENFVWNYEFGFRGDPTPWLTWDTSFFMIDNSDQIGTRTADNGNLTIIENAGRSFVYGWDLFTQVDVVGLADSLFNPAAAGPLPGSAKSAKDTVGTSRSSWVDTYGSLYVYSALTLQSGEFISGPNTGRTPQYLPDYVYRVGLIYNWRERVKIAFMGSFLGSSFADDTNTAARFIPAYDVWDLTVEAKVYKDYVSIIGGVNNIFNSLYYARIRADGIDPAMPRNWYAGVKVAF